MVTSVLEVIEALLLIREAHFPFNTPDAVAATVDHLPSPSTSSRDQVDSSPMVGHPPHLLTMGDSAALHITDVSADLLPSKASMSGPASVAGPLGLSTPPLLLHSLAHLPVMACATLAPKASTVLVDTTEDIAVDRLPSSLDPARPHRVTTGLPLDP